jgi:hypothetical protein
MTDYNALYGALTGAANQTARSMPTLGLPAIMAKPIVEAGMAGIEWGGNAVREANKGNTIDPAPSLFHMANIYGLGGPAAGLTSGGAKAAPFFSAAMRAAESAPLKTGANQQWLGWLKNQPGIKQEELDWMGVPEWLSSQPGPVTKQQVTDYIGQNKVDVQEVVKGGAKSPVERAGGEEAWAGLDDWQRQDFRDQAADNTKFSQYQLPGGENYRELLLTMPTKEPKGYQFHTNPNDGPNGRTRVLDAEGREIGTWPTRDSAIKSQRKVGSENFNSGHYDEPNVLAHVRFNDRVDANGKKTLFLEEIQSDWHQKGRKQGYKGAMTPEEAFKSQYPDHDWSSLPEATRRDWERTAPNFPDEAVPDAPFKSSWPELSLKRMIKWAADNGYDSVSWTPGKVQAARYDLSKQMDGLEVIKEPNGTYELMVKAPGEQEFRTLKTGVAEKDLPDHIGKELSEKALKEMDNEGFVHYEGVDLQVGGEGMAGFYDKILPSAANKLGKKYGAKVGVSKVQTGLSKRLDELEAARQERPLTKKEAEEYDRLADEAFGSEEVWSLPITPELKAKATGEGFSLFTGGKGGTLGAILNQALTGQKPEDNQSSLGDILSRSLKK